MSSAVTSSPSLFKLNVSLLNEQLIQTLTGRLSVNKNQLASLRFKKVAGCLYQVAGGGTTLAIEDKFFSTIETVPLINKPTEFRRLHWSEITYGGSDMTRSSNGRKVLKKAKS